MENVIERRCKVSAPGGFFADPDDADTVLRHEPSALLCRLHALVWPVPICSVGLQRNAHGRDPEVHAVSSELHFLLKVNANGGEGLADPCLKSRFRYRSAVALKAAEPSASFPGKLPKPLPAVVALHHNGRPAAFFAAVHAPSPAPLASEHLAAPFADNAHREGRSTFPGTVGESVGVACPNRECGEAHRADLLNHGRGQPGGCALATAKPLSACNPGPLEQLLLTARLTRNLAERDRGSVVTSIGAINGLALPSLPADEGCPTVRTGVFERHWSPMMDVMPATVSRAVNHGKTNQE